MNDSNPLLKRKEQLKTEKKIFLSTVSEADEKALQVMRNNLEKILKDSLERLKYDESGRLNGILTDAGIDVISALAQTRSGKISKSALIERHKERDRRLDARFVLSQEKIATMDATTMFYVIAQLRRSGIESAISLILGEIIRVTPAKEAMVAEEP